MRGLRFVLAVPLLAYAVRPAAAKIIFTGYGDFRLTPHGVTRLEASPLLAGFGVTRNRIESRGANVAAIGTFAATRLSDRTEVLVDVTYREIGVDAGSVRLQYAFAKFAPDAATEAKIGKFLLPFGYYNDNRFYPFQRPSVSAPAFISSIQGLPIAQLGAGIGRTLDLGSVALGAEVYAVNGYGSLAGSTTAFRNASAPGGLVYANNIRGSNNNHKAAFGGRLRVAHEAGSEAGASYYRGEWDPAGRHLHQMGSVHAKVALGGLEVLGEYLLTRTDGDRGMVPNFSREDWTTDGFFVEASYRAALGERARLTPWLRYEDYRSTGVGAGQGREKLRSAAGGVAYRIGEGTVWKMEVADLFYNIPFHGTGPLGLTATTVTLGLVLTY